jgi:hypothetical protein
MCRICSRNDPGCVLDGSMKNSTLVAPKAFYGPPRLPSDGVLGEPRERISGKIIPCRIEFVGKKSQNLL